MRTARAANAATYRWAAGLALTLGVCALGGCDQTVQSAGVPGDMGVALFDAPTTLVFEHRLLVGSSFVITVSARRDDDVAAVSGGELASSDEDVLQIAQEPASEDDPPDTQKVRVTLVGPGEANLEVRDSSEVIDTKLLKAARAETIEVYDQILLSDEIDARLADAFGIVDGRETMLSLGATDVCGGPLIAMNAASATSDAASLPVKVDADTTSIVLTPDLPDLNPVTAVVTLTTPGFLDEATGEPAAITREITVYPPSAVDEVDVAIARGDGASYLAWGRAYVDDNEVIGLSYSWAASARVTLQVAEGPWALADVSQPGEDEPADVRPAELSAEVFGVETTVDLLAATTAQTGRLAPLVEEPAGSGGCGGADACDPYVAFVPGLVLLRRRRRKRAS